MPNWRKQDTISFINPYNFVSLSAADVTRSFNAGTTAGDLSGVIECTLRCRTPMALPDMEGLPQAQLDGMEHKGQGMPRGVPFFRTPTFDNPRSTIPTIPGSELRGVVRSAFETLDNGCLSVNNSNVASARSPLPLSAALLVASNGTFSLYDAEMVSDAHATPAQRANGVFRRWLKLNHANGTETFWLVRKTLVGVNSGQIEDALEDYRHVVELYRKNDEVFRLNESNLTLVPDPCPSNGAWPIFYKVMNAIAGTGQKDVLYLSPAQITRTVFRNRVDDLLGSHASCKDSSSLCESCFLFGMVGEDDQAASHVRFSDGVMKLDEGESYEDWMIPGATLKELSAPKPSSTEFYTKRPLDRNGDSAISWTYDGATFGYYADGHNAFGVDYQPDFDRYPPGMETIVRGRKFYLHHHVDEGNADERILEAAAPDPRQGAEKTPRNMTTEVAKSQTVFRFRVYFDGVSEEQLCKLVWVLCIGENSLDGHQLHMIGHAKPLGFGSSKVRVDRVLLRSAADGYGLVEWNADGALKQSPFTDASVVKEYLSVTDFNLTAGYNVCYPLADNLAVGANARASHNWFVANRSVGNGAQTSMTPSVYRALPALPTALADRSNLLLPKYVKDAIDKCSYDIDQIVGRESTARMVPRRDAGHSSATPQDQGSASGEVGVIAIIKTSRSGDCFGEISRSGERNIFFHTSRSPKLDLRATPLKKGMRVSFVIGKNTGGRNPNQDCACDIEVV